MTLSPAELTLKGKTFDVIEFSGTENLNSYFIFKVSFIAELTLSLNNILNSQATLTASGIDGLPETWTGTINHVSSKQSQISQAVSLSIVHPLFNLQYHSSEQQFYYKNEFDIALKYLDKHQLAFELKGLNSDDFEQQELIHQMAGQSDLDFFHQLLARIGVMFCINKNNQLCLFKNISFLANSHYDTLSYLPEQYRFVQGVPHFYNLSISLGGNKSQAHIYSHRIARAQKYH